MSPHFKEILATFQGFSALGDAALTEIAAFAASRKVRVGETIFAQGEPSPYFFGVCSGEVVIQRVSKDKRFPMKMLGTVGPGGLFGESAIFEESPRAAMASASQDGELLLIRGSEFRKWLAKSSDIAQPLLLSLLKTTTNRLYKTSHELTVVHGMGRLLGSGKSFDAQIESALDFLRSSLEGLDEAVLYQRSPYWEEFSAIRSVPMRADLPAVPVTNALIQKVAETGVAFSFDPKAYRMPLEAFQLDWGERAATALIPLFDWDRREHNLQGLLFLSSASRPEAFASDKQLLLTSLSHPLSEALARHHRQEDTQAQERLNKSRQNYPK